MRVPVDIRHGETMGYEDFIFRGFGINDGVNNRRTAREFISPRGVVYEGFICAKVPRIHKKLEQDTSPKFS